MDLRGKKKLASRTASRMVLLLCFGSCAATVVLKVWHGLGVEDRQVAELGMNCED
eukprot:CAMPEP_0174291024 /NCGR_PEP_ID=MMETSP0809-20121228/30830_1 /TAXON_ID=73025 ORGANISM="Eutreptiella gymnastica-like, Strain CCMP1594" /NCGR_SAMPLE_ID=MMETSP0809 /ASSEMBLY_ACC=CAM_ASM_000658 /LENGTH=54 /DNA_ID=CAMNT_0015390117 /DNA_START=513 /DNA_END=674 /DNA_ORIENTATION=-